MQKMYWSNLNDQNFVIHNDAVKKKVKGLKNALVQNIGIGENYVKL